MSDIHRVKSWTYLFQAALDGIKTHDVRYVKERDYKVGDTLILCEWDLSKKEFTGRELSMEITYITSKYNACALSNEVLDPDCCILSFRKI